MNDPFERDLRAALSRREPPLDFTGRVIAQLPVASAARRRPASVWWKSGAIAAGVALLALSGFQYQEYRRAMDAKQQLMFALELTAQKLHVAHDKVNQRNQQP